MMANFSARALTSMAISVRFWNDHVGSSSESDFFRGTTRDHKLRFKQDADEHAGFKNTVGTLTVG